MKRVYFAIASSIVSLLVVHSQPSAFAEQGAAQKVQGVKIRVSAGTADVEVTGTVDQLIRITVPKGTIGVHVASGKGTADYEVAIMRAPLGAEPKTLTQKDFKPVETFALKAGATASRSLLDAIELGVSIPTGLLVDSAGGAKACTCCVTCSNGVIICGCRFQSSCGNCP